ELWRYTDTLPDSEAATVTTESLLERTNPNLKERLQWEQHLVDHGTDPQFTAAVRAVEKLRPGRQRTDRMNDFLRSDQMDEKQRTTLVEDAGKSAGCLQFATSLAPQIPRSAGCLVAALICLAIWSAFLWAPAVRNLLWGGVTVFAGAALGASIWQAILHRR